MGGLLKFLRITALSLVLLAAGAMVSWTTNVADVAPAVARLGRLFKLLRCRWTNGPLRWHWRCGRFRCCSTSSACCMRHDGCGRARCWRPAGERRRRWVIETVDLFRRWYHRRSAACRRDGGCDHRARWNRPDFGRTVGAASL